MTNIRPVKVDIAEDRNESGELRYVLKVHWSNGIADRRTVSCGSDRKLAERFKKAILAGVAYTNVEVATDIYGVEYVTYFNNIYMKRASAELRKLGF